MTANKKSESEYKIAFTMNLAWIPNSLTMGNLLLGFISMIFASQNASNAFAVAGSLILGAALLDGLDGQVARALKVSSPLGAELDSLADCVAFGVAPGYLAYKAYLSGIYITGITFPLVGNPLDFGIFIASIFPICAAYRLARFNVISDPSSFSGLPSPVAGVVVALIPLSIGNVILSNSWYRVIFAVAYTLVALLMVSTVKYSKPQSTLLKNINGIKITVLIAVCVLLVVFLKLWSVVIILTLYILSGILSFIIQFIQDHKY